MKQVIRIIDVENTGERNSTPAVVEFGYCDLVADSIDLSGAPCDWRVDVGAAWLVNPGRPIPPEAQAIHNITDEDVAGAPCLADVVRACPPPAVGEIVAYAAHSAKDEQKVITTDFTGDRPWVCTLKGALRLWPDAPSHSNNALRYWRRPAGLVRELALPTHRAFPDAYVTSFLLRDLLNEAALLDLVEWTKRPSLLPRCKIGKWRGEGSGTPWKDVDSGFLRWLLDRDFDEDTMHTARFHLEQREIDQRLEREQADLNRQLAANGMPAFDRHESPPLSAYEQDARQQKLF